MKNILQIILISFFTFTIVSCAKKSDSSSSSTVTTMSTPTIADGNYKVTAYTQGQYYSDGSHYTTTHTQ
jgi:glutamine cyclotransferase